MLNLKDIQATAVKCILNVKKVEHHYGDIATERFVELVFDKLNPNREVGTTADVNDISLIISVGSMVDLVRKERVTMTDGTQYACTISQTGPVWVQAFQGPVHVKGEKAEKAEKVAPPATV